VIGRFGFNLNFDFIQIFTYVVRKLKLQLD